MDIQIIMLFSGSQISPQTPLTILADFCPLEIWLENIDKQGNLKDAREITAVWCWNVKKNKFVAAILDFWRPSWIDNGEFLTLYSIYDNDHLY